MEGIVSLSLFLFLTYLLYVYLPSGPMAFSLLANHGWNLTTAVRKNKVRMRPKCNQFACEQVPLWIDCVESDLFHSWRMENSKHGYLTIRSQQLIYLLSPWLRPFLYLSTTWQSKQDSPYQYQNKIAHSNTKTSIRTEMTKATTTTHRTHQTLPQSKNPPLRNCLAAPLPHLLLPTCLSPLHWM